MPHRPTALHRSRPSPHSAAGSLRWRIAPASLAAVHAAGAGAGRRRRRRPGARGAAQAGQGALAIGATGGQRDRHPLAHVGRLLGAGQPPGRRRSSPSSTRSMRAGPAPTSKTGCATTGCWNWASAATGPTCARDFPRFRMNDDREVSCYALLTQHLAGNDVRGRSAAAPGSRSAMPTTAARCWPRTLFEAKRVQAPTTSGSRCGRRSKPTARAPRAPPPRCSARRPRSAVGEHLRQPAALAGQRPARPSAAAAPSSTCWR